MSYYSGRSSYSGLGSSYSSYSRSSYDSYGSWRNSYSSSSSPYKTRTYDFGTSNHLSKGYGSDMYSRKYSEYSWKAKDLLTDNPANQELDVKLPEHGKLKYEQVNGEDIYMSKDEDITVDIDNKETEASEDDDNKGHSSKNWYSSDEDSVKDNTRVERYSSYTRENYSTRDDTTKYSSKIFNSEDNSTKDNTRVDTSSDLSSKKYLRNDETKRDTKDYSSKRLSKEELDRVTRIDDSGDILIRGSRKKSADTFSNIDHKSYKDDTNKVRNGDLDINMNYSKYKSEKESTKDKYSLSGTTHEKPAGAAAHPKKNVYNFEEDDDEVFIEKEKPLNTEKETIFYKKNIMFKKFEKSKESKTSHNVTDSAGPLRMHRQRVTKYISAVPDERRYISSVNFLPDRIELRFCGAPPEEKKLRKCRSITDLYEITVRPQGQQDLRAKHPWEDTIHCKHQDISYCYDSENEILHYTKHKHDHNKEMYITQYTHYFDPNEPRTHIAGWKVDYEPSGIPHEKSRMCVVRSPVVSDSHRRVPRPKSAPPHLYRPTNRDEFIRSQKVDVVERGSYSLPRRKLQSRPAIPREFITSQNVDVVDQGNYTIMRENPASNLESFFHSSMDDSQTEEASSIGYAPSDDTSDSSAFYSNDPRHYSRYHHDNQHRDPANLAYSKPKLIRLSAEFPGVRNLEKMKRKRQSMGSASSGGSVGGLSPTTPRNGEYGLFVALTSGDTGDPRNSRRQQRYSHS